MHELKALYSRVHGQVHLAAQLTSGSYGTFKMPPGRLDFWCSKGKKWDPPVTSKLKVREVSQSGFWNISSQPTSEPTFSQIGWPQLLAPGTLSQTMTLSNRPKENRRTENNWNCSFPTDLVCFTAVLCVVTQRSSSQECCMTTQRTASGADSDWLELFSFNLKKITIFSTS